MQDKNELQENAEQAGKTESLKNAGQADKKEVMSNKKLILILCSPILLPMLIIAPIMLGMFIGCGWLFVSITFLGSASAAAIGICGIIGAFMNVANGVGAVLIAFSCGFIGLGLIYPIFFIAKEFFVGFLTLSREIFIKMKDLTSKAKTAYKKL